MRLTRVRRSRAVGSAVIALLLGLIYAVPAQADGNTVFREHFTGKDSHIEQEAHDDFCVLPFLVRWSGRFTVTETVTPATVAHHRAKIARALMVWRIASGRGIARTNVAAIADGRLLTPTQAAEVGLCDGIGTLEDALTRVARLAGLGDDFAVVLR